MIVFDFSRFTPEEILGSYSSKDLTTRPSWEKELVDFLAVWLHKEPHIQAKTSGSTGKPKALSLKKEHMIASAKMTAAFLSLQAGNTALLNLPLRYIAGKMMLVRSIVCKFRLIAVAPSAKPLQNVAEQIDFGAMVPNQVFQSLDSLSQIKTLLIGGGPIHADLTEKLIPLPGNIYHTYGMTETVTHVAVRRLNGKERYNYFQALPQVEFQQDHQNCLIIHAPKVSDQTLQTHDVVELLDSKRFIWKGRFDNVILSGGIKIHPEEVEKALATILDRRFFVASKSDPVLGEKLILLLEGEKMDDSALHSLISQLPLSSYQFPKEIHFVSSFAETATGKVQRKLTLTKLDL
ncbi:MAG: AMP-binding protein [Bacteroidota bacterium]